MGSIAKNLFFRFCMDIFIVDDGQLNIQLSTSAPWHFIGRWWSKLTWRPIECINSHFAAGVIIDHWERESFSSTIVVGVFIKRSKRALIGLLRMHGLMVDRTNQVINWRIRPVWYWLETFAIIVGKLSAAAESHYSCQQVFTRPLGQWSPGI